MKNNFLLPLLFFLLSAATSRAGWNIESGKVYYITCNYAEGWLGLGQYQNSGYPIYYQTSGAEKTDDAWWKIIPDGNGYAIQNNLSKEYLSWSDDYSMLRNLDLATEVTDNRQRWTLEENAEGIVIRSLYNSSYHLNARNHTYYVALYSGSLGNNSIFNIWDKDGNRVMFGEEPEKILVESITLSGKATMAVGEKQQININVLPENAENRTVSWTSSDSRVVAIDNNGQATALTAGTATITATANDGSNVAGSIEITTSDLFMHHGKDMLYLRHFDSTMTVIPRDFVTEYTLKKKRFNATLVNDEELNIANIMEVGETVPQDVPAFSSYKFNNKYNPQVFTDAVSAHPSADTISLRVAGIGKWLTASFQTADPYTRAEVDGKRQKSKRTRQSFAQPVTYQLTNSKWEMVKLRKQENGTYKQETGDFIREQTVNVIFATDSSTNSYLVPRIDITLLNADGTTSTGNWGKYNWIGVYGKGTYMSAQIEIDGGGVFPDMAPTPVQIKGRGNSSWSYDYMSKNPYRLKFAAKQKPLGMTAGKSWILLANKQSGSMTTNAVGMKLATLFGTAGANHIVPVELYINGSYRGSYNLTEKVGFSNNSIDLADETLSAMIEMDTYNEDDGTTPDYNNSYFIGCKVKEPDFDDEYFNEGGLLTKEMVFADFYNMQEVLKRGDDSYTNLVDADYLVRYLSANEAMHNLELGHPKSVFTYSEDVTNIVNDNEEDPTPWIFGPVWDCDWAFGYDGTSQYFIADAETDYFEEIKSRHSQTLFWEDLRRNSEKVDSTYYQVWTDVINNGGFQEMTDFCDEYYTFAQRSFSHNRANETNNKDVNNYRTITNNCKKWLTERLNHIYNSLTPYPLRPEEDDDNEYTGILGDANSDGTVSVADLVSLLNHLSGQENDTFMANRADTDGNGSVTPADEEPMLSLVWNQTVNANRNNHLPQATISIRARSAAATPNSETTVKLQLIVDEGTYSGLQMDVQMPDGVELAGVVLPADMAEMTARTHLLSDGLYRVVIYANGQKLLPEQLTEIGLRVLTTDMMEEAVIFQNITSSTSLGEEERLPSMACRLVVNENGTDAIRRPTDTTNANERTATYDLSGRIVRPGNRKGVYIKDGKKYVK